MPHERRSSFVICRLLPPDEERCKENRSFLNGLPTLRQESHSSVPKTRSGPHSQTASQCQTVIGLHCLRLFQYRSRQPPFSSPSVAKRSARHNPFTTGAQLYLPCFHTLTKFPRILPPTRLLDIGHG